MKRAFSKRERIRWEWRANTWVEGEKGPIEYHWARKRVVESRDQLPGPDIWLLARRSISNPKQIAYYLASAPAKRSLASVAFVASQRYTVEQCIEEAKGETGLDEYEVRRLLAIALPLPVRSSELRLAWSLFRRRKRLWARRSHYRRRAPATLSCLFITTVVVLEKAAELLVLRRNTLRIIDGEGPEVKDASEKPMQTLPEHAETGDQTPSVCRSLRRLEAMRWKTGSNQPKRRNARFPG